MGSIVAGLSFIHPRYPLYALIALLPVTIGVGLWWLRRKLTFQQAGLPYLYRLANFPNNLPATDKLATVKFIQELIDPTQSDRKHLIIAGPIAAGKTPLAVGIGTEFAFRMGVGRYTSLTKLLDLVDKDRATKTDAVARYQKAPDTDKEFNDGRILWPWISAQLLIVDDVDRALGIMPKGASPEECLQALAKKLTDEYGDLLQKLVKIPRVVWILSERLHSQHFESLVKNLAEAYGAPPMQIQVVTLMHKLDDVKREKGIM
jgi:hypothetical protein